MRDRHREELAALENQLRAERAEIARLTAVAARRDAADRARAAAPPTAPMPGADPPTQQLAGPAPGPPAAAMTGTPPAPEPAPAPPDPAEPLAEQDEAGSAAADAPVGDALDAPGPLRAAARPVTPTLGEDQAPAGELPDSGPGAFQLLKERLEGLFSSNGHTPAAGDDPDDEDEREHLEATGAPLPRRSATAARARAGATVAARRSPVEVWGLRVLAGLFVVVLLLAFVLVLISVA